MLKLIETKYWEQNKIVAFQTVGGPFRPSELSFLLLRNKYAIGSDGRVYKIISKSEPGGILVYETDDIVFSYPGSILRDEVLKNNYLDSIFDELSIQETFVKVDDTNVFYGVQIGFFNFYQIFNKKSQGYGYAITPE